MTGSAIPASNFHQAFGLGIRSELVLPELLAGTPGLADDVTIRFGAVPEDLPDAAGRGVRYASAPGRLLLRVDGVARYLIVDGKTITIDRQPGAEEDDIRVFLLGSAFGALLHQRQDLVLHGSAIDWHGEAVVFMGRSGVGKSTTATAFRKRGHAVLTDDLCVVRPDASGRMLAWPGFPQCKLWLDSLKQLDVSPEGLARIRRKLEKRALPLHETFATIPLPVKKIFLLRPHNRDELKLTPAQGPAKFNILKNHTYRFGFLTGGEGKAGHFQQALKLAQQAPLTIAVRPSGSFRLDELVDTLSADLRT